MPSTNRNCYEFRRLLGADMMKRWFLPNSVGRMQIQFIWPSSGDSNYPTVPTIRKQTTTRLTCFCRVSQCTTSSRRKSAHHIFIKSYFESLTLLLTLTPTLLQLFHRNPNWSSHPVPALSTQQQPSQKSQMMEFPTGSRTHHNVNVSNQTMLSTKLKVTKRLVRWKKVSLLQWLDLYGLIMYGNFLLKLTIIL